MSSEEKQAYAWGMLGTVLTEVAKAHGLGPEAWESWAEKAFAEYEAGKLRDYVMQEAAKLVEEMKKTGATPAECYTLIESAIKHKMFDAAKASDLDAFDRAVAAVRADDKVSDKIKPIIAAWKDKQLGKGL